ncbi:MAG: hypothetical protein IJ424_03950 [Oscillospiraceae bacterium]|nr:hypothetical protein [Oscillospiraceae bacterium]
MTVLSYIIQKCGIIDKAFSKSKFDLNAINCLIFGNIGGYPIGAKSVSETVNSGRLSKQKAEELMCFSFSCGPAFAIGVSYSVYGNSLYGLAAFSSIFVSNLVLFMIYSFKNKKIQNQKCSYREFSTKLIVEAVSNAATAMVNISAMIAAFSALTALLECILPHIFVSVVPSVFEISNISELKYLPLPVLTALLAFGGLCVHMQLIAIVNGSFKMKKFFATRFLQVPLAAIVSIAIDCIFNLDNYVTVSSHTVYISQSNSIIPFICMISMISIIFLTKIKQRKV